MTITADDPEEVEEERRLCYVGITRAEEELTLTCARRRMIRGETQYNKMSRFLKEIPMNCCLQEPFSRSPSRRKKESQAHISRPDRHFGQKLLYSRERPEALVHQKEKARDTSWATGCVM